MDFGQDGVTVEPGSLIRTSPMILTCTGEPLPMLEAKVHLPAKIPVPELRLRVGATHLGRCDDLFVSAEVSHIGPWPLVFKWVETTGQLLPPVVASTSEIRVPRNNLPATGNYTIYVEVDAKLTGAHARSAAVNLQVSTNEAPRMSGSNTPISVSCFDKHFSVFLPHQTCGKSLSQLVYVWKISTAGQRKVNLKGSWEVNSSPLLRVPMSELRSSSPNGQLANKFFVDLRVYAAFDGTVFAQVRVAVTVSCTPIVRIMGGSMQTISVSSPLKVSAIVETPMVQSALNTERFRWQCVPHVGDACMDTNNNRLVLSNQQDLEIAPRVLPIGLYTFSLQLSYVIAPGAPPISAPAMTGLSVNIVQRCIPLQLHVTSYGFSVSRVAKHWPLHVRASIDTFRNFDNNTNIEYTWDTPWGVPCNVDGNTVFCKNDASDPVLSEGLLTFSVRATQFSSLLGTTVEGLSSTSVEVPPAPQGGGVGFKVLERGFQITTHGWQSVERSRFAYFVVVEGGEVDQEADRQYLTLAFDSAALLMVEHLPRGNITIGAIAKSRFGQAIAHRTVSLEIPPIAVAELALLADAAMKKSRVTGNLLPVLHLFDASMSSIKQTRSRRQVLSMEPSGSGSGHSGGSEGSDNAAGVMTDGLPEGDLPEGEQFMCNVVQFYADSIERMGNAVVDKQWKALIRLKSAFQSLDFTTVLLIINATSRITERMFASANDQNKATGADGVQAATAIAMLEALSELLHSVDIRTTQADSSLALDNLRWLCTIVNLWFVVIGAFLRGPEQLTNHREFASLAFLTRTTSLSVDLTKLDLRKDEPHVFPPLARKPEAPMGYSPALLSRSDCQPSSQWLGGMSIASCLLKCPSGFVHATKGDQNCKCANPFTCKRAPDTAHGLALYEVRMKREAVRFEAQDNDAVVHAACVRFGSNYSLLTLAPTPKNEWMQPMLPNSHSVAVASFYGDDTQPVELNVTLTFPIIREASVKTMQHCFMLQGQGWSTSGVRTDVVFDNPGVVRCHISLPARKQQPLVGVFQDSHGSALVNDNTPRSALGVEMNVSVQLKAFEMTRIQHEWFAMAWCMELEARLSRLAGSPKTSSRRALNNAGLLQIESTCIWPDGVAESHPDELGSPGPNAKHWRFVRVESAVSLRYRSNRDAENHRGQLESERGFLKQFYAGAAVRARSLAGVVSLVGDVPTDSVTVRSITAVRYDTSATTTKELLSTPALSAICVTAGLALVAAVVLLVRRKILQVKGMKHVHPTTQSDQPQLVKDAMQPKRESFWVQIKKPLRASSFPRGSQENDDEPNAGSGTRSVHAPARMSALWAAVQAPDDALPTETDSGGEPDSADNLHVAPRSVSAASKNRLSEGWALLLDSMGTGSEGTVRQAHVAKPFLQSADIDANVSSPPTHNPRASAFLKTLRAKPSGVPRGSSAVSRRSTYLHDSDMVLPGVVNVDVAPERSDRRSVTPAASPGPIAIVVSEDSQIDGLRHSRLLI